MSSVVNAAVLNHPHRHAQTTPFKAVRLSIAPHLSAPMLALTLHRFLPICFHYCASLVRAHARTAVIALPRPHSRLQVGTVRDRPAVPRPPRRQPFSPGEFSRWSTALKTLVVSRKCPSKLASRAHRPAAAGRRASEQSSLNPFQYPPARRSAVSGILATERSKAAFCWPQKASNHGALCTRQTELPASGW